MTTAGISHPSSPRLPSPPPFTEVQIGPKSPLIGDTLGKDAEELLATSPADERRIRPGTKALDMAAGPPLIPLSQLDSPFQLQEHLKALYNHYTRPEGSDTVVPITRHVAAKLAEPPEGVDRSLWLYELCRFLTMKVNNLITAFFAEDPPCSSQTCPEMRASEWQYLCAVHDPPKSCCAIDYCCHTLDWATNILTSTRLFPSRLTLGGPDAGGGPQAMRHLTNIFRRLYRIFAHAWFQHRDVFWQVEGHDGLYIFFKTVCDMFALIPEDNYTVPPEAEGIDPAKPHPAQEQPDARRITILRKEPEGSFSGSLENIENSSISTGATTRRHKNSPSINSRVTTISESAEDEDVSQRPTAPQESTSQSSEPPAPATAVDETPESAESTSSEANGAQVTVAEVLAEDAIPEGEKPADSEPPQETPAQPTQPAAEHTGSPETKSKESKDVTETDRPSEAPVTESAPSFEPDQTDSKPADSKPTDSDAVPETASAPESASETEAKPEVTPDATPDATPEGTPEATPEATPEGSPEVSPEVKHEATPENSPNGSPKSKPAEPETESNVEPQPQPEPAKEA